MERYLGPVIAFLLACADPAPVDIAWPEDGCASVHVPAFGSAGPVVPEEFRIQHDGDELRVRVLRPAGSSCWPALVLVPPGFAEGLPQLDEPTANSLAAAGLVVVAFDPSGRGMSSGEEDYGGPVQQDDLAAVLAWTASLEVVDPARVAVVSRSLGIAMAAGALARHDVAPFGLVDIEGPAVLPDNLDYAPEQTRETLESVSEGSEWWAERSPHLNLGAHDGLYRRIQALEDHALGSFLGHAQALLNTAVDSAAGTDLNGLERDYWTYDDVEADALDGRVKHDDRRALDLVLSLYDEQGA